MQVLTFRADEKTLEKLNYLTEKTKLKKSKIIRKLIDGVEITAPPIILVNPNLKAFDRIGNNINQIAKKANESGVVNIDWLVQEFEKLREEVKKYGDN
jgi:hypothetical protein